MVKTFCKVFKSRRGRNQGCLYVERLEVKKSEPIFFASFLKEFFNLFLDLFLIILFFFNFQIFQKLSFCPVMLPWPAYRRRSAYRPGSAHDLRVIARIFTGGHGENAKKFRTCIFFSIFQKSRQIAENAKKKWFFVPFFVNKNRVFLEAKFPKMHYKNHHLLYDKCSTFSLKNRM